MIEPSKLPLSLRLVGLISAITLAAAVVGLTAFICNSYHRDTTVISSPCPPNSSKITGSMTDMIQSVVVRGTPECQSEAYAFYLLAKHHRMTPERADHLISCYMNNDDQPAAAILSQLMTQRFPNNPKFFAYLGYFHLALNNLDLAIQNLNRAVQLADTVGMEDEDAAVLHNNFAWALLQLDSPNLDLIQQHSYKALQLDSYNRCSILHTRLTYEFAKLLQSQDQDPSDWAETRRPYVECVFAMQSPELLDDDGSFHDLDNALQLVSTDVMDSYLLNDDEPTPDFNADFLAPAEAWIDTLGPADFCQRAMGLRNKGVQQTCLDIVKSAKEYWSR